MARGDDRGRIQDDGDGEGLLAVQRAVAGVDGDVEARVGGVEDDLAGIGDGDLAGRGIDGEAAARGVADQRIGHGRPVDVGRGRGHADGRAGRRAVRDLVDRAVAVDRGRGRDVGDGDGEGLRTRQRAVAGLRGDGIGVAGPQLS